MALATIFSGLAVKSTAGCRHPAFNTNNFVFISLYALANLGKKRKGQHWLDVAKGNFREDSVEGVKAVYNVITVFAFYSHFLGNVGQSLSRDFTSH